jgi:hypothetical protein
MSMQRNRKKANQTGLIAYQRFAIILAGEISFYNIIQLLLRLPACAAIDCPYRAMERVSSL